MRLLTLILTLVAAAAMPADVAEHYVYPMVFGNESLTSCSGAPKCGAVLASINGINAFSNGANQCTGHACAGYGTWGYKYQCVELAQRYMNKKYGTAPIWHANAKDMCGTHPKGIKKTSKPKKGDLVVFGWGTYGHVAVISGFNNGKVKVVEQNSSKSGKNSYSKSDVKCYLTSTKNSW